MTLDRRQFLKMAGATGALAAAGAALGGCGSSSGSSNSGAAADIPTPETLYMEWLPSESTADYENMRDVFAQCISEGAGGIPCETVTTTDINVVVEAICAGTTHYAYLGASEYIEAHAKNPAVQPAWVLSDSEGKLNPVTYHSQVLCREEDAAKYKKGDTYELGDIAGTDYAFVSASSTSGFVIPATVYAKNANLESTDDIATSGKYLGTVTMAGSHALSLYTLLSGDADLCSCDDTGTCNYYEVVEGENGEVGAVYQVKEGMEAPLDEMAGQRVVVVASYATPGAPFCVNTSVVPAELNEQVVTFMCSDAVSGNPELFKDPADEKTVTKWKHSSDLVGFVELDDSYYDDFRTLLGKE